MEWICKTRSQKFVKRGVKICKTRSQKFITETWLKESIDDSVLSISGYCVFRRDRKTDSHGGVCIYVNTERLNNFTVLDDLNCCELFVYISHVNASGRATLSSRSSYSPSANAKQTRMVTTPK